MELHSPQYLGVLAIEKRAFGSPSTKGRQLLYYKGTTKQTFRQGKIFIDLKSKPGGKPT